MKKEEYKIKKDKGLYAIYFARQDRSFWKYGTYFQTRLDAERHVKQILGIK